MGFLDLCKERYSVRRFDVHPVEKDKLMMVLEAGRLAPTACNFVVSFLLDIGYPAVSSVNHHTPRKELSATVTEL